MLPQFSKSTDMRSLVRMSVFAIYKVEIILICQ
ncbi:hypothetical protein E2C01_031408 [Portunus trituberculatus]|uniref:Uncharacterized protein n=1 Tax=Portunus trituberculatus TaxID=210409 RepID=A0A5B7EYH3_PORTR|nr:hypothetical protein [Portunus trituberculatus]